MSLMTDNKAKWAGTIKRAAWIRVGALGDLLVGLASLAEMHEFFPAARVMVVGPRLWLEIIQASHFPWIDSIAVIERRKTSALIYRNTGAGWAQEGNAQELRMVLRGFDAVVNTNIDSTRYAWEAFRAGVQTRIGSAPSLASLLYTHSSPFFGKDPLVHERDVPLLLMEFATSGAQRFLRSTAQNRCVLDHWIATSELVKKWRQHGLPAAKTPLNETVTKLAPSLKGRYVLVNPTSSRREKAWPSASFKALIEKIEAPFSEKGIHIAVIGSGQETDWLREVAGSRFAIVQPATIGELQDVVHHAEALVTNTSSMQFIAASCGTKTLTLMGRARPEIWGPLGPKDHYILGQPPNDLAHDIFSQELEGYRSISVEAVADKLTEMIL